jgi:uncharacterized protein YidB (DUF937 family)
MFFLFDSMMSGVVKGMVNGFDPAKIPDLGRKYLRKTELRSIPGLLRRLQEGGLEAEVASWLGAGKNLPVTPSQLRAAIGERAMSQLANAIGLPVSQVLFYMADLLPPAVKRMSSRGMLKTPLAA